VQRKTVGTSDYQLGLACFNWSSGCYQLVCGCHIIRDIISSSYTSQLLSSYQPSLQYSITTETMLIAACFTIEITTTVVLLFY